MLRKVCCNWSRPCHPHGRVAVASVLPLVKGKLWVRYGGLLLQLLVATRLLLLSSVGAGGTVQTWNDDSLASSRRKVAQWALLLVMLMLDLVVMHLLLRGLRGGEPVLELRDLRRVP